MGKTHFFRGDYDRRKVRRETAQRRLGALEDQMDRLVQLYTTKGIDRNRYEAKKTDLEWKILAARAEFESAGDAKVDPRNEFDRAQDFLRRPGKFWKTATTRERTLSLPLFFQGKLQRHAIKRVGTLRLDGSNCQIWLPRLDSNQRPAD